MIGSVPLQYPPRLIWQRRHRSVRIYAWHGPDVERAKPPGNRPAHEALALDYNAGQDAAIQLEIVQTAEGGWLIRARGWNKRA